MVTPQWTKAIWKKAVLSKTEWRTKTMFFDIRADRTLGGKLYVGKITNNDYLLVVIHKVFHEWMNMASQKAGWHHCSDNYYVHVQRMSDHTPPHHNSKPPEVPLSKQYGICAKQRQPSGRSFSGCEPGLKLQQQLTWCRICMTEWNGNEKQIQW